MRGSAPLKSVNYRLIYLIKLVREVTEKPLALKAAGGFVMFVDVVVRGSVRPNSKLIF
jgi:hypothetical protein